tara:strand:- start:2330 stop:4384 length:2055 start_codon:yes stop_codon:yes gene_type:complete
MATLNLGRVRLNFKGEYSNLNGTALEFFDAVTFNGSLFVVTATNVTVNDTDTGNRPPTTTGQNSFLKIAQGLSFRNIWNTNTIYYQNDIVFYANTSYIALQTVPTSTSTPDIEVANSTGYWAELAKGFGSYKASYDGATALNAGDIIVYEGNIYRAKVSISTSQNPANTPANFDVIVPGFNPVGTWSAGTYKFRQVVEFHGQSFVVTNTNGTTQQPLSSTTGLVQSDWKLFTGGFQYTGTYNGTTGDGYYPGDFVDYNNALYAITTRLPLGTIPTSGSNLVLQAPTLDLEDLGNIQTSNAAAGSLIQLDANGNWVGNDPEVNFDLSPNGGNGTIVVGTNYTNKTGFGATSLVPKSYVDGVTNGLDVKHSCRVATTGDLSASYGNNVLTAGSNGAISIDTINIVLNDRVLVKDQTNAAQNGIYYVSQVGDSTTPWKLTRAGDADAANELTGGAFTFIEEGSVNQDNGFVATHNGTPTLGTTSITWEQFSGAGQIDAGQGLTKTGNTLNVNVDNNSIRVYNDAVEIKDLGVTNAKLAGSIDLTTKVANQLPVPNGGTGLSTLTVNGVLYGNGTNNAQVTAAGTGGYALYSNSGTPDWTNEINGGTFGGTTGTTTGMLAKIKVKRSEIAFSIPNANDIEVGEIAVNTVDKKIYIRDSNDTIVEVANQAAGGAAAAADDGFINALIFG